ncbi:hypothetical protein LNQ81_17965 [Myroides sp. M-43]|uniref:hypothetical protein n=1 Tax=Myroides oncorhynchi TaxID=2893756 RepID=UPI001E388FD9|nr:hypothetical protein [Myroides oncorhynchi]MCC9044558.1 hypothetical protein [Myroides oncorhynchi]
MATLTIDQIKEIEEFLITQYNIKYQDTREEVLDHIACEIEELMNEGYEYRDAFEQTFINWKVLLKTDPFHLYKNTPYFISKNWIEKDSRIKNNSILLGIILAVCQMTALVFSNSLYFIVSILLALGSLNIVFMLKHYIKMIASEHAVYLKKRIKKTTSYNALILVLFISILIFQHLLKKGDLLGFTQGFIIGGALFVPFSLTWTLLTYKSYKQQLSKTEV